MTKKLKCDSVTPPHRWTSAEQATIRLSVLAAAWHLRPSPGAVASHVAFGAFFPSPTKPAARRATPALLREATALPVPKVAIGGITPDNGGLLTAAGADLLAVISSVYQAPDIGAAVRAYHSCFPDKT